MKNPESSSSQVPPESRPQIVFEETELSRKTAPDGHTIITTTDTLGFRYVYREYKNPDGSVLREFDAVASLGATHLANKPSGFYERWRDQPIGGKV